MCRRSVFHRLGIQAILLLLLPANRQCQITRPNWLPSGPTAGDDGGVLPADGYSGPITLTQPFNMFGTEQDIINVSALHSFVG